MKRAAAVLAVATILTVAGCSSSGSSSSDDDGQSEPIPATTSTPASATYTETDLEGMLLTVTDLPTGWSVDNSPDTSDSSSTPSCFQELQDVTDVDDGPEAEAKFEGSSSGIPAILENIGVLGAGADDAFDEAKSILDGCTDVSFESDGEIVSGTIGALSIPESGDESAAWRMTFEVEGLPFSFEFSLSRVGELGVIVAVVDIGGTAEGLLAETTATAVGKVASEA